MSAPSVIELLRAYGPPALVLIMALNRLGLIPGGMLILVTTGTLAFHGAISVPIALLAAYLGVMLGDTALYGAGRFGLGWLTRRQASRPGLGRAVALLGRWGVPVIFFTRWLVLPLTIAVSLICGANHFSYRPFLLWGAAGNFLFTLLFVALGYRFNVGWQLLMARAGGLLSQGAFWVVALALVALATLLYRRTRPAVPRPTPTAQSG